MRLLLSLALALLAHPATAWEFRPLPVCTVEHKTADTGVSVTYDPAAREYAITVTRAAGWTDSPVFAIRFEGPHGMTISTTRHALGPGNALTVTDRGFGNVLNGLQLNHTATAILGAETASVPLAGAAEPVAAFRACTQNLAA